MRVRVMIVALLAVGLAASGAGAAFADDGTVLVSDNDQVQMSVDSEGTLTATVSLSNNSAKSVRLSAASGEGAPPGCQAKVASGSQTLPAHRQQKVAVNFTACDKDKALPFVLTAAGTEPFELTAQPPAAPDPNWWFLMAFAGAAFWGAVLMLIAFAVWEAPDQKRREFKSSLPGLGPGWTFKDSWASNATVVAAAFTGLFGATGVATTILGDEADDIVAIVGVASAAALGLAGLSPMLLQALRTGEAVVSVRGLLFAAILTFTAAGGELGVVVLTLANSETFGRAWWVLAIVGLLAAALLSWYALAVTAQNLRVGFKTKQKAQLASRTAVASHPAHEGLYALYDDLEAHSVTQEDALITLFPNLTLEDLAEPRDRPSAIL